jgi:hypothetical protein
MMMILCHHFVLLVVVVDKDHRVRFDSIRYLHLPKLCDCDCDCKCECVLSVIVWIAVTHTVQQMGGFWFCLVLS